MKRSAQEILELVVFALIALILGTGVVWVVGWLIGLTGTVLMWLAGLVWSLLRFLVPVAVVVGGVYLLVRLLGNNAGKVARDRDTSYTTPPSPWTMSAKPASPEPTQVPASTPPEATDAGANHGDAQNPERDADGEGDAQADGDGKS